MIIKSKARKNASFAQLYDYINRSPGEPFTVSRNLLTFAPSREEVLAEFERNARHLPQRRNGNVLYHEILSLKRAVGVDLALQKDILHDLATRYLEQRAERLLAYGRIHEEKEHLHFHLMISANGVGESRRFRLERSTFNGIQRDIEAHLLATYPEIKDRPLYREAQERRARREPRTPSEQPSRDSEVQLKRRSTNPTKKDQLKQSIERALAQSKTREQLTKSLAKAGITLETRGKHTIATQAKLHCRLATLGLERAYEAWNAPLKEQDKRREELARLRAKQEATREREQGRGEGPNR